MSKQRPIKVGLIGESSNDSMAIQALLQRGYHGQSLQFVELISNTNGSVLDKIEMFKRVLRIEFETQRPDVVILIRDLDAPENDRSKVVFRQKTYRKINKLLNKTTIFLLNIHELEALILSDIETFNAVYGAALLVQDDPMAYPDPKELLISATRKLPVTYAEAHCRHFFHRLNFQMVRKNCRYFADFLFEFEKRLA